MAQWLWPQFRLKDFTFDGAVRDDGGEWVCGGGPARLRAEYALPGDTWVTMEYAVSPEGVLALNGRLSAPPSAPDLFRIGVEFALEGRFDALDFYGLGPFENYCDRKSAARIGHYRQRVGEQYHWGYVRPQESGNHEGLRYLCLRDADGYGLCALSDTLFSGSALPLSREALDLSIHEPWDIHTPPQLTWWKHYHSYELLPQACLEDRSQGGTWVHLDARQMGVGGINTWGALPLEPYRIPAGNYNFSFRIFPLEGRL